MEDDESRLSFSGVESQAADDDDDDDDGGRSNPLIG